MGRSESTSTSQEALDKLRERAESIPAALRAASTLEIPDLGGIATSPRIWLSGVGSSAAHASFLAVLLHQAGHAAAVAPLADVGEMAHPDDAVLIFSQGLSAGARRSLSTLAPSIRSLVVTSVDAEDPKSGSVECRRWIDGAARNGVLRVGMPGAMEYGTLLRLVGPMSGYLVALRLGAALGVDVEVPLDAVIARVEQVARADHVVPAPEIFDAPITLLASGAYRSCIDNLSLKVVEGLWKEPPSIADVVDLAHGPFQQAFLRDRTWVAFTYQGSRDSERLKRFAEMIPSQHTIQEVPSTLPFPHAIFEHEAIWNRVVLDRIEDEGLDQARWPGFGEDRPLYDWGADVQPPMPREPLPASLATWTSPDVESFVAAGSTTAILPLGSTEQHGAHLPLATDTWIADALARRLAARLPHAFALPALPFGLAAEHLSFPGTLSLEEEPFAGLLENILGSLAKHGIAVTVLLSAHGGNGDFLGTAAERLERAATPAELVIIDDLPRITARLHAVAGEGGVSAGEAGLHAGEIETSILLDLAPAQVRRDAFASGVTDFGSEPGALFYPDLRTRVPGGVVGDPRLASARRAEAYLEAWVDELLSLYRERASVNQTKGTKKA